MYRFRFTLRHIDVFSAFKVGCLIQMAILTLGGLFCLVPFVLVAGAAFNRNVAQITSMLAATPLLIIPIAAVFSIGPGLSLAFYAIIYNFVARFFGGFAITLQREDGPVPQSAPRRAVAASQPAPGQSDPVQAAIDARRRKLGGP